QAVRRNEGVVADLLVETQRLLQAPRGFAPLTEVLVDETEVVEAHRETFRRIDAAEGGESGSEGFLGREVLPEAERGETDTELGARQIRVLGSAAQQLVGEVRVARGPAVLALFGEKEREASGEAARPQRIAERAQRFVRCAQVEHGAVQVAPA